MPKRIVVYYSFSNGNTKKIAQRIGEKLNADLAEIKTVKTYPAYGGFSSEVVSIGKEEVENNYLPEILPLDFDLKDYDEIIIGTPTWWYTMAPAVLTFLKTNNFKGKTVVPFMTHGGWPGKVLKDVEKNCKGAAFKPGLEIQFDSQGGDHQLTSNETIDEWIDNL